MYGFYSVADIAAPRMLVVDDASTDRTWEICNVYISWDNRVKCFGNLSAEGVFSARKKALNQATGQWITF